MNINLETLEQNSPETLVQLKNFIDSYLDIQKDLNFVQVELCNREGRSIIPKIREAFPKYDIFWKGEPGTIGTIYVTIPRADWNDELKAEISKFDSFVGHHTETHTKYVPKKDVELPSRLQSLIKYRIELLTDRAKVYPNVKWKESDGAVWTISEVKHDIELRSFKEYLEPVEYVDREWDEPLHVSDWLNSAKCELERIKDISIELN